MRNYTIILRVSIILILACMSESKSSYRVTQKKENSTTVMLTLSYSGADDYYLKNSSRIVKELLFCFGTLTYNEFGFKIVDPNAKRFEVPQGGIFPTDLKANFSFPIQTSEVRLEYTENPFDFKIIRKTNNAILFSTFSSNIIFSQHYLQIGTEVDSKFIYGLGERLQENFRRKEGKWTIFSRDRGKIIDKGNGKQTYGYYPFYLLRERQQLFHLNYFRSSNAMDVIIEQNDSRHFLTYKVIGGILDFRFYLGDTPQGPLKLFHEDGKKTVLPPFWSFGFHQCRHGYKDITYLQEVISGYEKNGLPLDTIWTDIDYMIDYEDFTIDEQKFPLNKMKQITQKYKYIPIIDAGIKNSGHAYEEGLQRGVYIMNAEGNKPYVGKVWPGSTTFVDFFHPNASKYWQDMLQKLYQKIEFDGVWLDMNQLANFCNGACEPSQQPSKFDYSLDLPYQPSDDGVQSHTISLNSTHYGNNSEADVHIFNGLLETAATYDFLKGKDLQPFIITRSTTIGSNNYGFHWTGDNVASWEHMRGSIPDIFNSQMFGLQMTGADICGFAGNTTEELCARWFQLGSLYPFARDHNTINTISQEPYALGQTVLASAKTNLLLRYSLLKFYFKYFLDGQAMFWRPLFFDYPQDENTYHDQIQDTQILITNDLMAAPILVESSTERQVYFPGQSWVNMHTLEKYQPGTHLLTQISLTDPVPLFVKQGSLVYVQSFPSTHTSDLDNSFNLIGSLKFDSKMSNQTHQFYGATCEIPSITDYNNEAILSICKTEGCSYKVEMLLKIKGDDEYFDVITEYKGRDDLRDLIMLNTAYLNIRGEKVTMNLDIPVFVGGTAKISKPRDQKTNLKSQ